MVPPPSLSSAVGGRGGVGGVGVGKAGVVVVLVGGGVDIGGGGTAGRPELVPGPGPELEDDGGDARGTVGSVLLLLLLLLSSAGLVGVVARREASTRIADM